MKRIICLLVVLFSFLLPMAIFAGDEAEKEEVKKYEIVLIGKRNIQHYLTTIDKIN